MEFNVPAKVWCLLVREEIPGKMCLNNQHCSTCHSCESSTTEWLKVLNRLRLKTCALPEGIFHNNECIACGDTPIYGRGLCTTCFWLWGDRRLTIPTCTRCNEGPIMYGKERLCFYCFCEKYSALFFQEHEISFKRRMPASILPSRDVGDKPLCELCHERPVKYKRGGGEKICDSCYHQRRRLLILNKKVPYHICPDCKKRPVAGEHGTTICSACSKRKLKERKNAVGEHKPIPLPVPRPMCTLCNERYVKNKGLFGELICERCYEARKRKRRREKKMKEKESRHDDNAGSELGKTTTCVQN